MARSKATSRRARQPDGGNRGRMTGEISDELIKYLSGSDYPLPEPPRKRQKLRTDQNPDHLQRVTSPDGVNLEYIVAKISSVDLVRPGSKLNGLVLPLERKDSKPEVWMELIQPNELEIEIRDERKNCLQVLTVPRDLDGLEDFHSTLSVAQQVIRWPTNHKPWAQFSISIFQRSGADCIRLTCEIKWKVCRSPYEIPQISNKPKSFSLFLSTLFPDPDVQSTDDWSAQDFYQSVHIPSEEENAWKGIAPPGLKTDLYPFQKRTVNWLLQREGVHHTSATKSELPISFMETKDYNGRRCFVSHTFGVVTLDLKPFWEVEQRLQGGILAEEMGLGKTVEVISLIDLHKRAPGPSSVLDVWTDTTVRSTPATLIITPGTILQQWISEINRHAPNLKVMHYKGINEHDDMDDSDLVREMAESDVVVSTYNVIAQEVYHTQLNPEKSLRREPKYPRRISPIMQLSWWRVCLDEAQMIESGVSNAALVARLVPRINAWVITGTPVRKDVNDLLGLLVFLRFEPFASYKHVWASLISTRKSDFRKVFSRLAIRHSKRQVRDELKLPVQRRYVITMPFTPIEEQNYQEVFNEMCEDINLDSKGAPLVDDWDLDSRAEKMRTWLVRLRQTALHPEVGNRNRRALGARDGPLRTVDEVLSVMIGNAEVAIRADQRAILISKLKRGQLLENSPRVREALEIWEGVVREVSTTVEEARQQVRLEQQLGGRSIVPGIASHVTTDIESGDDDENFNIQDVGTVASQIRLRGALEILHMGVFFCASAHYQLKMNHKNNGEVIADSPEYNALAKLEMAGYDAAKSIRQEILQEVFKKASKLMRIVERKAKTQSFVEIPAFPLLPAKGGLESRRLIDQLSTIGDALDAQATMIDEWREQTIKFLLLPLVDEDEELEITGDEYDDSKKAQEEVMVLVMALRTITSDRYDLLTGQDNDLTKFEVKQALKVAKGKIIKETEDEDRGPLPLKMIHLLGIRDELKPDKSIGSMKGAIVELRALAQALSYEAQHGNTRAQNELSIVENQLKIAQKHLSDELKVTAALEKETKTFISLLNARLEYYKQLQQLSDAVSTYDGPKTESAMIRLLESEEKLERKIATAKSKERYLQHLKNEAENPDQQRTCIICQETIVVGALTVCGHQYCKQCIGLWWNAHRNCPVCKKKLTKADLHSITYKPKTLTMETEHPNDLQDGEPSSPRKSKGTAIYSAVSETILAEIQNVELNGPSFSTKVDTLARHLIWLRDSDPGAKCIIYSQFQNFLEVLASAFEKFRIGYSSFSKPNGIEKFKNDPSIECFLLHSRAHSSGLNLVNANHVFLCEPLLNTALELQAIARVDRIGQRQDTNVWLYLIDGTVEESIHRLSVKRRMAHIGRNFSYLKGKGKELIPEDLLNKNLEEANSFELQQASLERLLAKGKSGEMVENEDLWECLFGSASNQTTHGSLLENSNLRFDEAVGRHLRAEAAEQRIGNNDNT